MNGIGSLPSAPRLGLLAGWGRFPVAVAEAAVRRGFDVFCLGIRDHADGEALRVICRDYREIGLARLGAAIRYFRGRGITQATMAGKIHKVRLFQRFAWLKHIPDWKCLTTFYPHFIRGTRDRRDDTLLTAIVEAYAADGITFAPATDFAPELLVKLGHLAGPALSESQQADIQFGWRIAKDLGRLDIGQTVAVKGQTVLAVEAIEGTDACIRRAGELCTSGGFTVVKVAKPQQDMRFDVPTVGMHTLDSLATAGAKVLAVEAGKTILVDQQECLRRADDLKLTIVALD
ncbi:MAG: LpxI family protein [Planctomycetes bacterium]|nr:LpxI family protein [Planctomycetota bacterium]